MHAKSICENECNVKGVRKSAAKLAFRTSFPGLPLGRSVSALPCFFAVARTHLSVPNGQPRLMQFFNTSVSSWSKLD